MQLRVGLGAILLCVIILGAVAWLQAGTLWLQLKNLYDHPLTTRRAVGELRADILLMHRGMKDLCPAGSEEEMAVIIQECDTYEADAFKQINILYDSYLGPRADIELAANDFIRWNAIREETIRLVRAGKAAEAMARAGRRPRWRSSR